MDERTRDRYKTRANVIKALAHPTRLYIVDILSREDKCVADLTALVGADMSTVSKHLSQLKSVGIVSDKKCGSQVYYKLKAPCVMNFFSCVEKVLATNYETHLPMADDR